MRSGIISAAGLMSAAAILSGCSGPVDEMGFQDATAAESSLSAPAAAGPESKAYAVAPDVDPSAAEACAALNVGPEVYAAIGKSTLSAESTTKDVVKGVVCSFATVDHSMSTPNSLTVGMRKNTRNLYKKIAPDSIPGWTRRDIPGLGDTARFYEFGPTAEDANHMLHVLEDNRIVALTAVFTTAPDSADLSASRYTAIVKKILG
ncbi:hypothetical protein M1E17_13770 [Arthrobacter sp. D1-29]